MGDVGDYYRDIAPYLKEGRKKQGMVLTKESRPSLSKTVSLLKKEATRWYSEPHWVPFVITPPAKRCSTRTNGWNVVRLNA